MQPKPLAGFVLAKSKTQKDIVNLGFDLPENYGKNERMAGLCEIIAVGSSTLADSKARAELLKITADIDAGSDKGIYIQPYVECKPGDIVAYAPFSDLKVNIGAEEWLFIEFKSLVGNLGKVQKSE